MCSPPALTHTVLSLSSPPPPPLPPLVIVKSSPGAVGDPLGALGPDADVEWGDFFFNLVSMCIVYAYFSKAAVAGESVVAILLCMGVAAFDILLLVMRWLCFEQYVAYG